MIWWLIVPALIGLPLVAVSREVMGRDRDALTATVNRDPDSPASSGQFVFTRHFFIAGLIEGPYSFELPLLDEPPSSER